MRPIMLFWTHDLMHLLPKPISIVVVGSIKLRCALTTSLLQLWNLIHNTFNVKFSFIYISLVKKSFESYVKETSNFEMAFPPVIAL
jgi:hypothetical protein